MEQGHKYQGHKLQREGGFVGNPCCLCSFISNTVISTSAATLGGHSAPSENHSADRIHSPWRMDPDSTAHSQVNALSTTRGEQHREFSGCGLSGCGLKGGGSVNECAGGQEQRVAVD